MLYYKAGKSKNEFALALNGTNQFLQNNVATQFLQWERNQAFTFEVFFTEPISATANIQAILDTRFGESFIGIFAIIQANGDFEFALTNGFQQARVRTSANVIGATHIALTYLGDSNANNINIYVDGTLVAKTLVTNTLVSTIVGTNQITIGYKNISGSSFSYLNNILAEVSFTNYAKTQAQILADIAAGTQLAGSGSFLFRLPLIYPKPNFNSLDSTFPIFETAQNLNMNLINYPNPLVKGINLIKI